MNVHNEIPLLLECVKQWEKKPTEKEFNELYVARVNPLVRDFFEDFYEVIESMNWAKYRELALALDAGQLEARLRDAYSKVEALLDLKLKGDVFLLGTFGTIDGYARFDCGTHRVFIGVDQEFDSPRALDVLMAHELTHVARESRPEVWEGWGLNPLMTQNEFTESQPVIEHLMGEGFSCAVSELVVPGEAPWIYVYQSENNYRKIYQNSTRYDEVIHGEIAHHDGDYGRLYGLRPTFSHYLWACEWVKSLLKNPAIQEPKRLVARCSKDFVENAIGYRLS